MSRSFIGNIYYKLGTVVFACLFSTMVNAQWVLDNDKSSLYFISIKKDAIGEVHHFKKLTGELSPNNSVTVTIALNSVETLIPIRNERMQSMLFNTDKFPSATISTMINVEEIDALPVGKTTLKKVDLMISLHGEAHTYSSDIEITKTDEATLIASTVAPIIVNAADFKLLEGIEALRKIAGLPSIASAVPVTAKLVFKQ
ncbi:YceI family protein [Thalassotalea profundi]|nr:YceI family protein [Thalassotalea profundi]